MVSESSVSSLGSSAVEETILSQPDPGKGNGEAGIEHASVSEFQSDTGRSAQVFLDRPISDDMEALSLKKTSSEFDVGVLKSGESSEAAAALTVQKFYRSYRTRRNLADCAVMNREYGWWNVLEGAILRQTSETFYAFEENATAATRWSRLKKKAAKVGKGLSKDAKARKLAIQHWLEAIDARHRYGHNLHFYYEVWEKSSTKEPFFYWLDVGAGKEVNLPECGRSKLQKQQIKYLGPKEREQFEVVVEAGKLLFKKSREYVNTPNGEKWIFVMSTSGRLYVAQKAKGVFQHSSFLAGAATKAAGRLLVKDGTLELMEAHSGHYHPTKENFSDLMNVLKELGTDLRMAKVQCVSDDMLLTDDGKLTKVPSGKNDSGSYEVESNTKEYEASSSNSHEVQVHESQAIVQSNAKGRQEVGNNGDSANIQFDEGGKYAKSFFPNLEGFHIQMLDRKVSNTESQMFKDRVASEIESRETMHKSAMDDTLTQTLSSASRGLDEEAEAQTEVVQLSLKWSSEAGPRLSGLSEIPREMIMKIFQGAEKPLGPVSQDSGNETVQC